MRTEALIVSCLISCLALSVAADEPVSPQRPIQALLVTGGCCHDYDRQKLILTRGISARANVRWTVVQQGGKTTDTPIPLYNDPNWADGFDIVVHNECFAAVKDKAFVDRILQPHQKGTPAILIHCAMHCYRVGDDRWFKFVGVQSPGHGPHYSYEALNVSPEHPIMAGFGDKFVPKKGELYHSQKIFDTATPLAQAKRRSDGKPQTCVWTNDYQGTRVFGTTMGHYNETMARPKYLDMMAKGLLWAVGLDPEQDFTPASQETNEAIAQLVTVTTQEAKTNYLAQNCCGDSNYAYKRPVTAKSFQKGNEPQHLTDGLLNTRWCASGSQGNEWVTVELEESQHVRALRLHWERPQGIAYRYVVETSPDNKTWTQVVDDSKNKKRGGVRTHSIDAPETRFIKVTFLGASRGLWGSLWELEASAGDLPELTSVNTPTNQPAAQIADVTTPPGFNVSLFGKPPEVNYPVCLTTSSNGEVFVGVDEQGSLGKEKGRGKVLRCIDTDGDGEADQINEFAKMDHPRGLFFDNGNLWVLHPPTFSVYRDTDGDGTADESEVLIEGISTNDVNKRGADHTTNGIRMGIDGWIYIAVGDFGFRNAVAKDGTVLSKRGGGVVRIRPDGTQLEVYAWGLRNIVDIAIDPYMNVYTRDNTNDGGGWDIRLSHIMQSGRYGYPSLYKHFTEEIMPPLADYGGGSGCGAMFFHDARWPKTHNNLLLTCDWGLSEVFSHDLPSKGATFEAQQDTFLKIPRPTDIDADASGRLYVSSWKNGKFNYDGPNIGFVAMVTPTDFVPKPTDDVKLLTDDLLVRDLQHPSAIWRETVQREILRRDDGIAFIEALAKLAASESAPMYGRAAAVFTLGQITANESANQLTQLAAVDEVREFSIRALTDLARMRKRAPVDLIVNSLVDSNPRVQSAGLIGLGRQSHLSAEQKTQIASAVLPLTVHNKADSPTEGDAWRQPDAERAVSHLAVRTLVQLEATQACIAAINGPYRQGALWALKSMHEKAAVDGLFQVLSTTRNEELQQDIWTTLIRLYHREGDFTADSRGWWGTRPDTTGPYYDRQVWSESKRIEAAIKVALSEANESLSNHIRAELKHHVVKLDGISEAEVASTKQIEQPIAIPAVDPNNPNQIANLDYTTVLKRVKTALGSKPTDVDATADGKAHFRAQSCPQCHTFANGQQPKGPHLVDIGKRYNVEELVESIVQPSKKIAQGFDTWVFVMNDGRVFTGFVVQESASTVTLRQTDGVSKELSQDDIEERVKQEVSMMPKGIAGNLTPEQLADLVTYLQSLH